MGVTVVGGDRMGMAIRFPSAWLLQPFDQQSFLEAPSDHPVRREVPTRFVDALRHALEPHLHSADLSVSFVSGLLGTSRQSLQRKLRANGTTLSAEIRDLRKNRAIVDLLRTDRPITEIAARTGFQNPTSFTRAFRSWTGESPREFRKNRRAI